MLNKSLLLAVLLLFGRSFAGEIKIKFIDKDLSQLRTSEQPWKHGGKIYLVGYSSNASQAAALAERNGATVSGFAGGGLFYFSLPAEKASEVLGLRGIEKIGYLLPESKIQDFLSSETDIARAFSNGQAINLKVYFDRSVSGEEISQALQQKGFYAETIDPNFFYFTCRADRKGALSLAGLPFVRYIGLQSKTARPLMFTIVAHNRANKVNHPMPNGMGLTGRGINVAVIDGGYAGPHIDFEQRIVHVDRWRTGEFTLTDQNHATHVTGIIGGSGHRVEFHRGMAPEVRLYEWNYADEVINKMRDGIVKYNTMICNNSYYLGEYGIFCGRSGEYVPESQDMDQLAVTYPTYLPVVASGNSGNLCANSWGTLPVGIQGSKNNIVVGRFDDEEIVDAGSSRGPTVDGRLKPELVAEGWGVLSTYPNSAYGAITGTSQAAPQISGAAALLQEAYKGENGVLPPAMLIKALLCNTAYDMGLTGPDFTHGYGRMDVYKAAKALQNDQYFLGDVNNSDSVTYTFSVPAGTALSKVMLVWTDPAATLPYSRILINDLDLYLQGPGGDVMPWVLDAANPGNPATNGRDGVNNIEQVSMTAPAAGTYTIVVKGYDVTSGPQSFAVVYQNDSTGIDITYPDGGENLPTGNNYIRWDANGLPGNMTLEYSIDNGANWIQITDTVKASRSYYLWNTPVVATSQALIRATSGGKTAISDNVFTIMPLAGGFDFVTCERGARLFWPPVPQATEYLIYQFSPNDTAWSYFATTTDTMYWVNNLPMGKTTFFNVYPKNGAAISRKTTSVQITMNSFSPCTTTNDVGVARITAPIGGRRFTSTALGASVPVSVVLKNFGSNTILSSFNVHYSVNGGPTVTQLYTPDSIPAGAPYKTFTFSTPYDFSAVGDYTLKVWTSLAGDIYKGNDTFSHVVRHLPNNPVALPYSENFEDAGTEYYVYRYMGMKGAEEFDIMSDSVRARARSAISDLYANSAPAAMTIDNMRGTGFTSVIANFLMTLNLQNYADSVLFLDFAYSHHGEITGGDNLYLKGADTDPALLLYDLFTNKTDIGIYKTVEALNLTQLLATNSQDFSSSTQFNFQVTTDRNAPSYLVNGGYSFDDIKVYNAGKDVAVTMDSTNTITRCAGTLSATVTVTVKNNTQAAQTNIPIYYSINGGSPVADTVTASIPAFGTTSFTFTVPVVETDDTAGTYSVVVWAQNPGDLYAANDTTDRRNIILLQDVTTPANNDDLYSASFELNDGGWTTDGQKSSWVWGAAEKWNMPGAGMGEKAWVTNLYRDYNNNEISYLYSPCLPTATTNTSLSFLGQLEIERMFDSIYVEYSYDGANWARLGNYNDDYNWYNATSMGKYWDNNISLWTTISQYNVPTDGLDRPLMLRFKLMTDQYSTFEGMGIDNVFYDWQVGHAPIFAAANEASANSTTYTPVYGATNDTIIAEIKGSGSPTVRVHSMIRNSITAPDFREHFLLNTRWFTEITSGSGGPMSLRLYFTDTRLNNLYNTDSLLEQLRNLRLVGYTGIGLDTSLDNNHFNVGYKVYDPTEFNIWPFKDGYFVEFETDEPGEFWLQNVSDNGLAYNSTRFSQFEANRYNDVHAALQWQTIREQQNSMFYLEYGTDGYTWQMLDSVQGSPNFSNATQDYSYIDSVTLKSNLMYYRLSQVDSLGNLYYAGTDTVDFTNTPVADNIFNVSWQADGLWLSVNAEYAGDADISIYNSAGALLDKYSMYIQKGRNYLGRGYISSWPAGAYILKIEAGKKHGSSRFIKP